MEIPSNMQKLKELAKSTKDKSFSINVNEVFHLWNHLVQRYSVIFLTDLLGAQARDEDLKIILALGQKTLSKHIEVLEQEMMNYGIALPSRPPKKAKTSFPMEQVTDRYIFRRILRGIQGYLPTHVTAFSHSTSPKLRQLFMNFLIEEMKLYDKMVEYGKLKGYEIPPPMYKTE